MGARRRVAGPSYARFPSEAAAREGRPTGQLRPDRHAQTPRPCCSPPSPSPHPPPFSPFFPSLRYSLFYSFSPSLLLSLIPRSPSCIPFSHSRSSSLVSLLSYFSNYLLMVASCFCSFTILSRIASSQIRPEKKNHFFYPSVKI